MYLKLDDNGRPVPVAKSFITEAVTIVATDTYQEVEVPAGAAQARLKSEEDFTIGEDDEADGFSADDIEVGICETASLWLKGTEDQVVYILWEIL